MLLYLAWKIFRGDFLYWVQVEGVFGVFLSFLVRVAVKIIVDFSGCLLLRHPCELGGAVFSASMVWVSRGSATNNSSKTLFSKRLTQLVAIIHSQAQVMPFVALYFYEGKEEDDAK